MNSSDFEKLGVFYLGGRLDPATRQPTHTPLLVDARELTTHAVIVGMTGSGKTGLGVTLLEEAALDGIPAIVIDPKGDLANLALAFPELRAQDFAPWVDADEARRKNVSVDALAAETAARWKQGLAEWGEDGARIGRLRDAAEVVVYTPGARLGVPLALLRSFDAPPPALRDAPDQVRERAVSAAAGLLGLVGVDADPVRSRELLLVATLLERAWSEGKNLTLADLVRGVNEPPFAKVGLFNLESFFPAKARFELALALNQLLASPGFSAWSEGETLDVARLLRGPGGRPRLAVISIAHLSDAQRMFFVTALLTEMVAWMRTQSGSSNLRALLYMDEIYGYFPPTAAPPSKAPMLTLLKQARAFGLGVVLATQNPVDLDYKGLGNAGTWMIGRLQTERDKARILDGLEGASAVAGERFERATLDALVGSLEPRQFLVHSVHQGLPVLMQTRWALTYLRGPMTREQLASLAATPAAGPAPGASAAPAAADASAPLPDGPLTIEATLGAAPAAHAALDTASGERPVLPPEVTEFFEAAAAAATVPPTYRPTVLASGRVRFASVKAGLDEWRTIALAARLGEDDGASVTAGAASGLDWAHADALPASTTLERRPADGARFAALPGAAARAPSYTAWRKGFEAWVAQSAAMTIWRCPALKQLSQPGESEAAFRARLAEAALAARADEAAKLRKKYGPKVATAEARVVKAQERVQREASQASAQTVDTAVSVGTSILGALFGKRATTVGNLGRARSATRSAKEHADVERAEDELRRAREAFDAIEREVVETVRKIDSTFDPAALVLEAVHVKPKKSDLVVGTVALLWRS